MTSLLIKDATRQEVLAEGEQHNGAFEFEGNFYFAPDKVQMGHLQVTERTYTCPYKGVCYWIDLQGADGQTIQNVAWVYNNPKKGFERIKDHIAFYKGKRPGTISEIKND